ncbi:hypothetical protein C8J57DRAFT_1376171 [Mycena rebaudengoi]|nr:hypothetical protein C8J57DRAFT_1376171 [Mycena rebaudengoi]
MHASLRVLRAHQPLIKFTGKRAWPSSTPPQAPHRTHTPRAAEFRKRFSDAASGNGEGIRTEPWGAVSEFWEAPERFWRPRVRELEESEIEAVLSGGASSY